MHPDVRLAESVDTELAGRVVPAVEVLPAAVCDAIRSIPSESEQPLDLAPSDAVAFLELGDAHDRPIAQHVADQEQHDSYAASGSFGISVLNARSTASPATSAPGRSGCSPATACRMS